MRATITADIHFHNWSDYHTITSDGINSRLEDILKIIDQIEKFIVKNKVTHFFILGDVFHSRSKLDTDVVSLAANRLYKLKLQTNASIVILLGNHDIAASNQNIHVLKIFEPFCTIIDKPDRYSIDNCHVYALPYCESHIQVKKHIRHFSQQVEESSDDIYKLFISHNGLDGAVIGPNEYKIENPVTTEDTNNTVFDLCLYGHYHKHQQMADNVFYVGSPLQHSFGERDSEKGFMFLDTDSSYREFVKTIYPRFVQCSPAKAIEQKKLGNYVKIDLTSVEDKRLLLQNKELAGFPIVDNIKDDTPYDVRLELKEDSSIESMAHQYVEYMHPEGLDMDLLKKQASDILKISL